MRRLTHGPQRLSWRQARPNPYASIAAQSHPFRRGQRPGNELLACECNPQVYPYGALADGLSVGRAVDKGRIRLESDEMGMLIMQDIQGNLEENCTYGCETGFYRAL